MCIGDKVTQTSTKVKSTITLSELHIKDDKKQPREFTSSESMFSEESHKQKHSSSWYPLKMVLPLNKSRSIFFKTRAERRVAMTAILEAQGFDSQLD